MRVKSTTRVDSNWRSDLRSAEHLALLSVPVPSSQLGRPGISFSEEYPSTSTTFSTLAPLITSPGVDSAILLGFAPEE